MKATHRLTYIPDGDVYLFKVSGDNYWWSTIDTTWSIQFSGFERLYVDNEDWLVVKLNTFKGNK